MSDKGRKLYNGITNIDDDIIMAALSAKPAAQKAGHKKHGTMFYVYTWGGVAAAAICLAIVSLVFVFKIFGGGGGSSSSDFTATTTSDFSSDVADATAADTTEASGGSSIKDSDDGSYSDSSYEAGNSSSSEVSSEAAAEEFALKDNQILVAVDFDEVDEITVSYPGYESFMMEGAVAVQLVDYVNKLGVLTAKEDYNDATTEKYATITIAMDDGQVIEITPKYPYIFIGDEVYECASKSGDIYNLSVLISEIVQNYLEDGE